MRDPGAGILAAIDSTTTTASTHGNTAGDDPPGRPPRRRVPGIVRLVSRKPIEIRQPSGVRRGPMAAQLEERPWLVALAILGLAGLLLAARRRD